jgi:hypothetical protein
MVRADEVIFLLVCPSLRDTRVGLTAEPAVRALGEVWLLLLLPFPSDYRYATCIPYVDAIQTECTIFNRKVREVTTLITRMQLATVRRLHTNGVHDFQWKSEGGHEG